MSRRAIAELQKLYGAKAGYRVNKGAPTAAQRAAAREALPALQDRSRAAKEAAENRRRELLQDPEYQRLLAEKKAADDERDRTSGTTRHMRITVGKVSGMFFQVTGEGDTWDEALAEARKVRS